MRVTLPLLYYHSLCVFQSSLPPLASTPFSLLPHTFFLLRGCMWRDFSRTGQAWDSYWWAVYLLHPSLIPEEPSTYQPMRHLIRASELLLVLRASEDQIRYWWKFTPPFQVPSTTFLQPSWSLFQHFPSQESCNIYIHNIIYIHWPFS